MKWSDWSLCLYRHATAGGVATSGLTRTRALVYIMQSYHINSSNAPQQFYVWSIYPAVLMVTWCKLRGNCHAVIIWLCYFWISKQTSSRDLTKHFNPSTYKYELCIPQSTYQHTFAHTWHELCQNKPYAPLDRVLPLQVVHQLCSCKLPNITHTGRLLLAQQLKV